MRQIFPAELRTAAGEILRFIPIGVWHTLFPKSAVGLCYHTVSDTFLPHIKHYPTLSAAAFERDLVYLQKTFRFTSYDELADRRAASNIAKDNPIVLTFDDGFSQCAEIVAPILLRRDIPCIFFVITDLIDNKVMFRESATSLCIDALLRLPDEQVLEIVRELELESHLRAVPKASLFKSPRTPLDIAGLDGRSRPSLRPLLHWLLTVTPEEKDVLDRLCARLGINEQAYLQTVGPYLSSQQIRQLHSSGFTIGAHSRTHRLLQTLSEGDAESEIVKSCEIVRQITGQQSVPFAFPYFGKGIDRAWLAGIRRRHSDVGLFFDTDGLRNDAPFVVQRAFGERFTRDRTIDAILRRAWSRPQAWGSKTRLPPAG